MSRKHFSQRVGFPEMHPATFPDSREYMSLPFCVLENTFVSRPGSCVFRHGSLVFRHGSFGWFELLGSVWFLFGALGFAVFASALLRQVGITSPWPNMPLSHTRLGCTTIPREPMPVQVESKPVGLPGPVTFSRVT